MFRGITTQDVKGYLLERRNIYMRVCELANHPNIIGFLQSSCKIWMRSEVYEMHINASFGCRHSAGGIELGLNTKSKLHWKWSAMPMLLFGCACN